MPRKKQYAVNRHKKWVCPYFGWDGAEFLKGKCGRPAFPNRTYANEYMNKYCAGCWEKCTLAEYWNTYMEEL